MSGRARMEQWEVLPKGMVVLGVIGGIAGPLTVAIYQTRLLSRSAGWSALQSGSLLSDVHV